MNPADDRRGKTVPLSTDEILQNRVEQIACKLLGKDKIDHNMDLSEAGMDSLAKLELLALLERELDVALTEDLISEFKTIAHVVRVVIAATPQ